MTTTIEPTEPSAPTASIVVAASANTPLISTVSFASRGCRLLANSQKQGRFVTNLTNTFKERSRAHQSLTASTTNPCRTFWVSGFVYLEECVVRPLVNHRDFNHSTKLSSVKHSTGLPSLPNEWLALPYNPDSRQDRCTSRPAQSTLTT